MFSPGWYRWEWKDRGKLLVLEPWVPVTRMKDEDGSIRRICVAPSPELAFLALRDCAPDSMDELYLYKLICGPPPVSVSRMMVPDVHKTGEQWLLQESLFERVFLQER